MVLAASASSPDFNWDIVGSASSLSALATVLAGFVFAVVVAMVTSPPRGEKPSQAPDKERLAAPLACLLASFFSLVLSALVFAIIAGGGTGVGRVRPFLTGACATWIMSLAVVQLAVGVAWLLSDYGVAAAAVRTGRWLTHSAVFLASFTLAGVLTAPLFESAQPQPVLNAIYWVVISAIPLLALPIGWYLRRGEGALVNLKYATAPALVASLFVTVVYGTLTSIPGTWVLAAYKSPYGFAGAIVMTVLLGYLFAVYEASLPDPLGGASAETAIGAR